jgi:hypothetical protein
VNEERAEHVKHVIAACVFGILLLQALAVALTAIIFVFGAI